LVIRSLLTALGFKSDNAAALRYDQILNKIYTTAKKVVDVTLKFGNAIMQSAGEMEQWEIAFETMLRSTEKANKLMQEVIEFAATTPFELPQVIEGSKRLLAFGTAAEDIIPTMTKLGNIAAGVGREKMPRLIEAFGKVKASGVLMSREMWSFVRAGVPLLEALAENFGVTVSEMRGLIRAGEVGFDDLTKAIDKMSTGTGMFANLMKKQSKTYLGILVNIKDQFTRIANEAGKQVLPIAKELANEVLKFLKVNREFIAMKIADFLKGVVKLLAWVFFFVKGLFQIMKKRGVLDFFAKAFQEIVDVLGFFVGLIINIIGFLSQFEGIITLIISALIAWKIAQWGINAALAANPISLIILGIIALIAIIWLLVKNWDKIMEALGKIWEGIAQWFVDLWEGIKKTALEIWEGIVEGLKSLWEGFKNFVIEIWKSILKTIEEIWNTIKGFIDEITGFFDKVGKGVSAKTAEEAWENILGKDIWTGFKDFLKGVGETIGIETPSPVETMGKGTLRSTNPISTINTIEVKTELNVTVPPGTTEETAKDIGNKTREIVKEELDRVIRGVTVNAPYTRGTGGGF